MLVWWYTNSKYRKNLGTFFIHDMQQQRRQEQTGIRDDKNDDDDDVSFWPRSSFIDG